MAKLLSVICGLLFLAGCETTHSFDKTPRIGMRFQQPYPEMYGGGLHAGLDIDVHLNTPVRSIADGTVMFASYVDIRGMKTNIVSIQHSDNMYSRYMHIDKISVKVGDKVKQGDLLAVTALNGPGGYGNRPVPYPHLHLEIYKNGEKINPELLGMSCQSSNYIWPVGC